MSAAPPLAGVVGWPIGHSRSPRLHTHWLSRYGIRGFYVPMAITSDDFEPAMRMLPKLGFRGVNVTVPFKERALALATSATERASAIGAANTLVFSAGEIRADNTDGYGFIANLRQGAPGWRADAGPAVVLGAGGAARAVIAALLDDGAPTIRVLNRTRGRAEALRAHFGPCLRVADWEEAERALDGATTIVNTTSLGLEGQPPLDLGLGSAPQGALVTDIVYQPLETPFLRAAKARGLATVDGLGMLLHQGAPGFASWFGVVPEVDAALRAAVLGP